MSSPLLTKNPERALNLETNSCQGRAGEVVWRALTQWKISVQVRGCRAAKQTARMSETFSYDLMLSDIRSGH